MISWQWVPAPWKVPQSRAHSQLDMRLQSPSGKQQAPRSGMGHRPPQAVPTPPNAPHASAHWQLVN